MMTFRCQQTQRSLLIGLLLFFVLSLQSARSYEATDDQDYLDLRFHGGIQEIDTEDNEFPDHVLDISKVKRNLDQYDRQMLLFEHNAHRKTTVPTASDMVFMVWSLYLQNVAKSNAKLCAETDVLGENDKMKLERYFSTVGISTWRESAMYKFLVGNVIHMWTQGKDYYNFEKNTCKLGKSCDRYIQVIWSTASHVGCALEFCPVYYTRSRANSYNQYNVICIYGEGQTREAEDGRYRNPFIKGKQCENCPTGFSNCIDGLCQTIPLCETVIDCNHVVDSDHCLCDATVYDHGHRLTALHWTRIDIWFTGAIFSSFIASQTD